MTSRWDFFLAYAGPDREVARALRDALAERARVFFDERSLLPGDRWSLALPEALRDARVIVVLVSERTRAALYQDSEIRIALDLLRAAPERYRVVPLLLDERGPVRREDLPYGLESFVSLSLRESGGVERAAGRLLEALRGEPGPPAPEGSLNDGAAAFLGIAARGPDRPVAVTSWEGFLEDFGPPLGADRSFLAHAVRGFFDNGGTLAWVVRVVPADACRAMVQIPTGGHGQELLVAARTAGAWGNDLAVRVEEGSRAGTRLTILGAPPFVEEDYDDLSAGGQGPNPLLERANASALVTLEWANPSNPESPPRAGVWRLAGGADGNPSLADYLGDPEAPGAERRALAALEPLGDVGLVCLPDLAHPSLYGEEREELTRSLIAACERQGRLALLSCPGRPAPGELRASVDSAAAALYHPWVRVADPASGTPVEVPAVGHVAGAYARNDAERGVHRPPLNLELRGLEPEAPLAEAFDQAQADLLLRRGINPLLAEGPDGGRVVLAGAVTAAVDETWRPVHVRRFFAFAQRALEAGTAWVAYAANDEATWERLRQQAEELLTRFWQAGALAGSTPAEAFFVRCDRTTMTQDDVDNGRVVLSIGLSLADSALRFPPAPVLTTLHAGPEATS